MITARWLEKRKLYWDRLAAILEKSDRRGLAALSYAETRELGLLYRQIAADLASVREDPLGQLWAESLNQLLARAHNLIYMGKHVRRRGLLRFYGHDFPRVFRQTLKYTLAAFVIFLGAACTGFLASLADTSFQRFFLGPQMSETIERHQMWTHPVLAIKPLASSAIMTNNLSVSFTTFAFGILGGIGTVYLLAVNGLLIGVIAAACLGSGMSLELWSFVAPHGVLELPSVFIAGGAGLLLARGLLFPGELPRRDALIVYGGQGLRLALGIIPLLIVAGLFEGFFSPSSLPATAKFACSAALGGMLLLYLAVCGREINRRRGVSTRCNPQAATQSRVPGASVPFKIQHRGTA